MKWRIVSTVMPPQCGQAGDSARLIRNSVEVTSIWSPTEYREAEIVLPSGVVAMPGSSVMRTLFMEDCPLLRLVPLPLFPPRPLPLDFPRLLLLPLLEVPDPDAFGGVSQ